MTEGQKAVWIPTRVTGCRTLDRSVARHNMEKRGFRKIRKKNGSNKSTNSVFARYWRQYA